MTPIGPVTRPHPTLPEYYDDETQRRQYVRRLFDETAVDYDRIERILALGTGDWYRREALKRAGVGRGAAVIDVGFGTGLLARQALALIGPGGRLVGVDPSAGMLAQSDLPGVELLDGTAEALPVADASFDFVTMGYALRHIGDVGAAFAEFNRVLKPGGTVLILEITRPSSAVGKALLKAYMRGVVPLIARLRTNRAELRELLRYYWATIEECVPPASILQALESAGFNKVERRRFGPMLNDYFAEK